MAPRNVSSYGFSYNTGHYTQLIWAKTRYVGCARRSYGGSYRPRDSRPLEYVLSEPRLQPAAPTTNAITADDQEQPGYFGLNEDEKRDLAMIGTRGALTSAMPAAITPATRTERQLGYFGGARLDPAGAQGAITVCRRRRRELRFIMRRKLHESEK